MSLTESILTGLSILLVCFLPFWMFYKILCWGSDITSKPPKRKRGDGIGIGPILPEAEDSVDEDDELDFE